ncbi:uncharacterized protein KZ484_016693 isoform 2-T2 [Pholidichthys leucotaenia]
MEDTGNLGLLWYNEDVVVDEEEEEEQHLVQPSTSSGQRRADLKDPDYQMRSRSLLARFPPYKRRPGRPPSGSVPTHLDLRICVLADSHTSVLSKIVFKNSPVQELQCPRGLQESDFLDLLRSTFPQLGDDEPFDIFTTDRSRRLLPLKINKLTPEEIHKAIKSTGHSALYIKRKTTEVHQSSNEEQDDETTLNSAASTSQDKMSVSSPRVQAVRRGPGRPRVGEEPTHHLIKIRILSDSHTNMVSNRVLRNCPVHELECPRGLPEKDFLDLLRSNIPQLGDNEPFDIFTTDRSRRLQPLLIKSLTPDEIYKATGHSALYIRRKTGEKAEHRCLPKNNDPQSADTVVIESNEAEDRSSPAPNEDVVASTSSSQQQDFQTEDEAESEVDSSEGKGEDKELDEDNDWKPKPELRPARKMTKKRRGPRSGKTACKVCGVCYKNQGSLIKHVWSHTDEISAFCGVCGKRFESTEELKAHVKNYQKTHDCLYCGKSFFTITGLNCHMSLHTGNRPYKCNVCGKTFAHMSGLSVHRWVHVEEKPYKCDICPKSFGLKAQLTAHSKVHTGRDRYHCNICGKSVYDIRSLTRHKLTHSGERPYGCQVCGKRFKLPSTLKSHEKTHMARERSYLCHICCKTFMSNQSLTSHVKTHSSERPFHCGVCEKGFVSNGDLKVHMRVHTGEAPYGCSECGRFFKRKTHLNNHLRTHSGVKLYVCGVCGKACSRQEHLTVHMRTHNGERPYQCTVCEKAFTQSHCLKTHMKTHHTEENAAMSPSTS